MSTQPEWHDLDDDARQPYCERAKYALYDLHACGREWSAWGHGTMTEADFSDAENSAWHVNRVAAEMYDIARQEHADAAARLAAAEAEVARLRAEVEDLRDRLAEEGLPSCAIDDELGYLMGAGLILYSHRDDDSTLTVAVADGCDVAVREALTAVGARETGRRTGRGGILVLVFDTDGGAA